MPFCKCHMITKLFRQTPHRGIRKRVSSCTSCKGSLTLEASLAIPVFLLACVALLSVFPLKAAVAKKEDSLLYAAKTAAVVADTKREDPYIRLYDQVKDPVTGRKIRLKVEVRCWCGYTGETFSGNGKNGMVYLTPDGTVYHTRESCSHLHVTVEQVSKSVLKTARNHSGEIYDPCPSCVGKKKAAGTVYITEYGTCYHNRKTCSGLKRTVMKVPASKAGGRRLCSQCASA